ncbi:nitrilase [Strigomonas culicis]|uniref:Nitrilase n=1 Tax=Strigomonas culicis TaxID=28005 RepID=S9W1C7_9TRYP|nr:nitrilase [Strigomonas culicis]|eukprot:EPY33216.1 nitrilase [Strigomonas culicis]
MLTEAAKRGSEFAVLPECFNCPYGTKYFDEYSEPLAAGNPTFDAISNCAKENKIWIVAGSIPEKKDGKLYNSSMIFAPDGTLKGVHRKVHLFRLNTEAVKFDEGEVLTAGDTADAITLSDDVKFGVAICFDIRYPFLAAHYQQQGTSFLVYPGAFNMVTGPIHWKLSAQARAVDNQQYVFLCSPARDTSAEYVAYGHSLIADPLGNVIAEADEKEGFVDCDVDFALNATTRERIPILKGVRHDLYDLSWKKK